MKPKGSSRSEAAANRCAALHEGRIVRCPKQDAIGEVLLLGQPTGPNYLVIRRPS